MGTSAFTGNDSGCSGMLHKIYYDAPRLLLSTHLDTSQISPTRSASDSPNPRIPPEQTLMPASRTAVMVSRRSSYDLVVITYISWY